MTIATLHTVFTSAERSIEEIDSMPKDDRIMNLALAYRDLAVAASRAFQLKAEIAADLITEQDGAILLGRDLLVLRDSREITLP